MLACTELSQSSTHPESTEAIKFKELTANVGASQPLLSAAVRWVCVAFNLLT